MLAIDPERNGEIAQKVEVVCIGRLQVSVVFEENAVGLKQRSTMGSKVVSIACHVRNRRAFHLAHLPPGNTRSFSFPLTFPFPCVRSFNNGDFDIMVRFIIPRSRCRPGGSPLGIHCPIVLLAAIIVRLAVDGVPVRINRWLAVRPDPGSLTRLVSEADPEFAHPFVPDTEHVQQPLVFTGVSDGH